MQEVSEAFLDDVSFKLGLRLDRMLIRLNQYQLQDASPRRWELESEFGRLPSQGQLTIQSEAAISADMFRRYRILPDMPETRSLRSRATSYRRF